MLSNIYAYQSQPQLNSIPPWKACGIGQQIDVFYNWRGSKKFHLLLKNLWNENDKKKWAAILLEYHYFKNFSVYTSDLYNYGNE